MLVEAFRRVYSRADVPLLVVFDDLREAWEAGRWTHFGQPEGGGGHISEVTHAIVAEEMFQSAREGEWSRVFPETPVQNDQMP